MIIAIVVVSAIIITIVLVYQNRPLPPVTIRFSAKDYTVVPTEDPTKDSTKDFTEATTEDSTKDHTKNSESGSLFEILKVFKV